jgi:ribosome-binding protein aMBF1 (putative translation factor)
MESKRIENKLARLAKENPPSRWKEMAAYKKENRSWLKKSVNIALRILDTLDEKGMTQIELASKLNVSRQQVSKILKGQENLTLETISKLEDVLKVSLITIPEQVEGFDIAENKGRKPLVKT